MLNKQIKTLLIACILTACNEVTHQETTLIESDAISTASCKVYGYCYGLRHNLEFGFRWGMCDGSQPAIVDRYVTKTVWSNDDITYRNSETIKSISGECE